MGREQEGERGVNLHTMAALKHAHTELVFLSNFCIEVEKIPLHKLRLAC